MEIQLRSTDTIKKIDGMEFRIWEGVTRSGISIVAFVARIGVLIEHDQIEFLTELQEVSPPIVDRDQFFPLRLLI